LRTVAARGRKEIERLKQEVGMDGVMVDNKVLGKRQVFEDNEASSPGKNGRISDHGSTDNTPGSHSTETGDLATTNANTNANIDEEEDEDEQPAPSTTRKRLAAVVDAATRLRNERKKRKRLQEMRVAKLEALRKRQREVMIAADQLELQRAKMAHSVGGVNKNGVKFKLRERKR
jgi:U3 small nucleolar RNA-associated protein 11